MIQFQFYIKPTDVENIISELDSLKTPFKIREFVGHSHKALIVTAEQNGQKEKLLTMASVFNRLKNRTVDHVWFIDQEDNRMALGIEPEMNYWWCHFDMDLENADEQTSMVGAALESLGGAMEVFSLQAVEEFDADWWFRKLEWMRKELEA